MVILSFSQVKSNQFHDALPIVGGVVFLFIASQIHISFQPMPITLQSLAVMLIGLTYTPKQAMTTVAFWHGLAACGVPVHAGLSGGLVNFMEPAAGYLFGYAVAAYLMATLKERFSLNTLFGDLALTVAGALVLYVFGVLWHGYFTGEIASAFINGIFHSILPDLLKAGIVCSGLQIMRYVKNARKQFAFNHETLPSEAVGD